MKILLFCLFSFSGLAAQGATRNVVYCPDDHAPCAYSCLAVADGACVTVAGSCQAPVVSNPIYYTDSLMTIELKGRSGLTCRITKRSRPNLVCGDFGWGYECRPRKSHRAELENLDQFSAADEMEFSG